jgi:hypothetical protein
MIRLLFPKNARVRLLRAATDATSVAFPFGGERRMIDEAAARLGVTVIREIGRAIRRHN